MTKNEQGVRKLASVSDLRVQTGSMCADYMRAAKPQERLERCRHPAIEACAWCASAASAAHTSRLGLAWLATCVVQTQHCLHLSCQAVSIPVQCLESFP